MRDALRWLIVLAIVLAVLGLVAYARGPEHHRGDEVGALGRSAPWLS
jgi:hypothetical protein